MIAVFDANILIDLLNGFEIARQTASSYKNRAVSIVTWMEVMAGAKPEQEEVIRKTLANFDVLQLTEDIAEQAVLERRLRKIKLPDAIAIATAVVHEGVLLTRNTRDFPADEQHIRIPYRLPVH